MELAKMFFTADQQESGIASTLVKKFIEGHDLFDSGWQEVWHWNSETTLWEVTISTH